MGVPKGFTAVAWLRTRAEGRRGGGTTRASLPVNRSVPDDLGACAEEWQELLRARNFSQSSVQGCEVALGFFIRWAAERDVHRASEVTRPMLEAYQRWLARYEPTSGKGKGRRLGWSAQCFRLRCLKNWFQWLTRRNAILHNPASELELPRKPRPLPTFGLTPEELARLFAVPNIDDPLGLRDRTILEVFYATGIRRAELAHLAVDDVQLERGTLTVREGKGRKDRVVPVGVRAAAWITRYLHEVRPRLSLDAHTRELFLSAYGRAFDLDVLSRMVSDWIKLASIGKKGACHLLRHTCATHMLEGGADVRYIQQLLGHESLESTAIYTQVTIMQLIEVHGRCHPSARAENAASLAPEKPAA
jgi:integrase/recombinase XerD